jgi:hydrogenase expression/formation protein HypC
MMCLALPMQLVERGEFDGVAELDGVRRRVGLMLCPEARAGDHVLVHAGYAIGKVDRAEAAATLELIHEVLREAPPE